MAKNRHKTERVQATKPELDRAIDRLVTARNSALVRFGVGERDFSYVVASERRKRGLGRDAEEAVMWFYGNNAHRAGGRSLSGLLNVTGLRLDEPAGLTIPGFHSLTGGLDVIDDLQLSSRESDVTLRSRVGIRNPQQISYNRDSGVLSYADPGNDTVMRTTVEGESVGRGWRLLTALGHVTNLLDGANRVDRVESLPYTF